MSIKIQLRFETSPNPDLEAKIENIGKLTRLFSSLKFKLKNGHSWSKIREAIIVIAQYPAEKTEKFK